MTQIRCGHRVCVWLHLATAQQLGADLAQLVAYDQRLLEAAGTLDLKTVSPH